jgi:3-oxoadipate enol-lactonase
VQRIGDIAVEVAGPEGASAPLILFLHGVGGSSRNWISQLTHFAALGFRAAAWDARGYGETGGAVGRFEDFADDAAAVIDALGGPAHVVGLSMGGRIALDLWKRHRSRVASLTLASTSAGAAPDPARVARALDLRLKPLLDEGRTPADIAESIVAEIAGSGIAPEARAALLDSHRRLATHGYVAALRAVTSFHEFPPFEAIDAPTLIVSGGEDRVAPPAHAERMAARIPGARLVAFAGIGHIVNIEAPAAFNAVLADFLAEQARP